MNKLIRNEINVERAKSSSWIFEHTCACMHDKIFKFQCESPDLIATLTSLLFNTINGYTGLDVSDDEETGSVVLWKWYSSVHFCCAHSKILIKRNLMIRTSTTWVYHIMKYLEIIAVYVFATLCVHIVGECLSLVSIATKFNHSSIYSSSSTRRIVSRFYSKSILNCIVLVCKL